MQTVRADVNAGELGSMPIPDLIVTTPLCVGIREVRNPVLAHALRELLAVGGADRHADLELTAPARGNESLDRRPRAGPRRRRPGAAAVGDDATFATPGELPPPPQPAASSARATERMRRSGRRDARQRIAEGITPIRLQQGNRICYLRVTGVRHP